MISVTIRYGDGHDLTVPATQRVFAVGPDGSPRDDEICPQAMQLQVGDWIVPPGDVFRGGKPVSLSAVYAVTPHAGVSDDERL